MDTNKRWYMAGTEKTGEYAVLAVGSVGRLGVRNLNGCFRVRFEPVINLDILTIQVMLGLSPYNWKSPNNEQIRFSTVVRKDDLAGALAWILRDMNRQDIEFNKDVPDWIEKHLDEAKLVLRPDLPLIEILRTAEELFASDEFMAMAQSSNGKPSVKERLIDLSVSCSHALDEMGVQS